MSNSIKLTYILSTKNKLVYLKYTLSKLLENKQFDEEIIIIDGNSSDGTVEYLNSIVMSSSNSIDILISENDKGESHALNKGLLLAKGELIKFIADDDIFCYRAIQEAKVKMVLNNEIDIIFGYTYNVKIGEIDTLACQNEVEDKYLDYLEKGTPFSFTGLSMMIRKSFLSIIGLFSTQTIAPDTDFSLRATSIRAKIFYIQLPTVVRVENLNSNYNVYTRNKFVIEGLKLFLIYRIISTIEYETKLLVIKVKNAFQILKNYFNNNTIIHNSDEKGFDYQFYNNINLFLEGEFDKNYKKYKCQN